MKFFNPLLLLLLLLFSIYGEAQEMGANFNHNAELIDFKYLEKAKVDWIRTTPRILDYVDGKLTVEKDPALQKIIEAGNRGYKIAFGFRWDFKMRDKLLPETGSEDEKLYFDFAKKILEQVGPHVDIFKLGNEPNLETLPEDLLVNPEGLVPLVRFTQRLLTEVVVPFYMENKELKMPPIYVGSFPRLFMEKEQNVPGVRKMIEFAQNDPRITGLSVHLHISDTLQIDQAFKYVRSIMPKKPIIVPEFSMFQLYNSKLSEPLTVNDKGREFVKKYHRNPDWKLYQWFGYVNTNGVSPQEWEGFFASREWFPQHNLRIYYDRFQKYGVILATYPLLQQSCPENMTPTSPTWFINPIFCQKSLLKQPNGDYSPNPLYFDDFIELGEKGRS